MTSTKLITAIALGALLFAGCRKNATTSAASNKIRVGYIGLTCEAPIFTAVEKGFFKEEGLEVEMVKCEWANYKDVLALGGFDITHHLVMYFLKPIEQGLDVKFTAGIHKGCLRVQASTKGNIHTVQDLRGKRIGVPGMGTPPFIFANRVLGANGIDASKDVSWRVFPAGELGLALDKGEVDAVADSEPIGSLLLADGKVRNVADQAADAPYKDEYCCAVIVNGKYLAANPKEAAAATRALLKGREVGRGESGGGGAIVRREKISRFESGAEHGRDFASALCAERFRRRPGGEIGRRGNENRRHAQPEHECSDLAQRAFVHLDGVSDAVARKFAGGKSSGRPGAAGPGHPPVCGADSL